MLAPMKDIAFIKNGFAVLVLAFLITACSHSPINPIVTDKADSSKTLLAESAQKPDFIIPPLDISFSRLSEKNRSKNRLIWDHIGEQLELTKFYDHPKVIKQKEKYLTKTDYLSEVTKRSEPFIHFVLTEIEKRQMPAELALLPIIESGYFPRARSRAKAEGLWQIMSYTGKELGLKYTYSYDGRHDVYAATSAALDYLAQMHDRFDGDWLLALAAYNAGPHRIKRAIIYSNNFDNEPVFWDLRLPRETREYIPKILAICSIIKDKKFNSTLLHPIADQTYLETIQLKKRISPAKLVDAIDVSESEIKLLNPALRNFNFPIHAGYQLLVPKDDVKLISDAIDKLPEDTQPEIAKHRISRGETLSTIARQYDTSVKALRETNSLHNNTIVAGRSLLVPYEPGTKISRASSIQNHLQKNTVVSKQDTLIAEPYVYVVAMGDSFWKIANRNNTTVQRLFKINGRNADQPLLPGETILVD